MNIVIYLQQNKTGQQKHHFSSLTIFVRSFLGMTCPCYSLPQDFRVQLHPWVMFVRCLQFVMTGNVLWTFCTGALRPSQVKKPTILEIVIILHRDRVTVLAVWSFEGLLQELRWGNKKASPTRFNTYKYYRNICETPSGVKNLPKHGQDGCMAFVSRPGIFRTLKLLGPETSSRRPSCVWSYLVVLGKCGTLAPGLGKLGAMNWYVRDGKDHWRTLPS